MEYLGLVLEFIFLAFGLGVYLFAKGWFTPKDILKAKNANEIRKNNGNWMRIVGLALAAIMTVNIIIHLQQLIQNQ